MGMGTFSIRWEKFVVFSIAGLVALAGLLACVRSAPAPTLTPTFAIPTLPAVHFKVDSEVQIILDEAGHPPIHGRRAGIVEAYTLLRDAGWDVEKATASAGANEWAIQRITVVHRIGQKFGYLEDYCAVKVQDAQ